MLEIAFSLSITQLIQKPRRVAEQSQSVLGFVFVSDTDKDYRTE